MNPSSQMKVLQVVETLGVGGMEQVAVDLGLQKGEHGFSCVVAALTEGGELEAQLRAAQVPVAVIHKTGRFDWRAVRRLAALTYKYRVDLIQAHNTVGMLYSVLAGLRARVPVIATLHGSSYKMPRRLRRLRRWLSKGCRYVVCVSSSSYDSALKVDHIAKAKLRLIRNGIFCPPLDREQGDISYLRDLLGLGGDRKIIISVGRLSYEKDLQTMVRAMQALIAKGVPAHLAVAGDGPEKEAMLGLINKFGLNKHVSMLGMRRDVQRLLRGADLFLQSSLSEGFSIAMLEAMAAGLPVAATNVGGNPELMVQGQTGLMVPPSEPDALCDAAATILRDPDLARRMGLAGAARVQREFSLDSMASNYAELYREALGRR